MSEQTITVSLPDSVYERIRKTAKAASLSSEEIVRQSLILLLPAFESDIPPDHRLDQTKLPMLNDMQLWKAANSVMDDENQIRLEELAETQKHRSLSNTENSELNRLMDDARQLMLCKAEAKRLLAQRGHTVFAQTGH